MADGSSAADDALRKHRRRALLRALPFVAFGIVATVMTLLRYAEQQRFTDGATRIPARVLDTIPYTEGNDEQDRVVVGFSVGGKEYRGTAVAYDRARYRIGGSVEILIDPRSPDRRVLLSEEGYDLFTPLFLTCLPGTIGLILLVRAAWWTSRVRRLAASASPAFAFMAYPAPPHEPEQLNLYAMDEPPPARPVFLLPLIRGQRTTEPPPFEVSVKGKVHPGGKAVAAGGGRIWWPRSSLKKGDKEPPTLPPLPPVR